MAIYYAKEFVGVRDGTQPVQYADGRLIDAKKRCIRAVKDNTNALVANDQIYVGRMPVGAAMKNFQVTSDTLFQNINVGTLAAPTKYVNGQQIATADRPNTLGPTAAAAALAPLADWEDVYVTVLGPIAAAAVVVFNIEYTISA